MRISEYWQKYRSEYGSQKDSRTKTKGIRAAWRRTNKGRNKGVPQHDRYDGHVHEGGVMATGF
jgi:hypothetical protein